MPCRERTGAHVAHLPNDQEGKAAVLLFIRLRNWVARTSYRANFLPVPTLRAEVLLSVALAHGSPDANSFARDLFESNIARHRE